MTRGALALLGVLAAGAMQATVRPPGRPTAAFHHFHFRVGEPAAAMNHGAAALNGTRVLLRGLGVGVRVGGVHALFDRADPSQAFAARAESPGAAYEAAATWLRARGLEIKDPGPAKTSLADLFASEYLDHIGFTASDLGAAVATLGAHGAFAVRQTDDAALFESDGGPRIELLRDFDAPDAFWCPMHPDVRSGTGGKCPICGMALVAMPAPRLGEYRMDVAVTAGRSAAGASKVRITLRDPGTERPVPALAMIHERLLHLFIIDRRLEYFRHVHPERIRDGVFELNEQIPPGEYVVVADFLPQGGVSQMVHRAIVTPGYKGPLFGAPPDLSGDAAVEKTSSGARVRLDASGLKAGKRAVLRFTLSDDAAGGPVGDLEPFLGAPGHMLIVNRDLTEADHVHPEEPATRGPSLTFQPLLPAGGFYKLWLQFQRKGNVITVPFVVSVAEP